LQDFIVAVDIGGSKILGAVLDRSGQILLRRREATAAIGKPDVVVGQVAGMITEMKNEMGLQEDDILGIGGWVCRDRLIFEPEWWRAPPT
jgi:glucokinase